METSKKQLGNLGEQEACDYLTAHGHTIICRNWRYGHYELDIISFEGATLHIVEVKSRVAPAVAQPEENVRASKRKFMAAAAGAFLAGEARKKLPADLEITFDVITVLFCQNKTEIKYYPRAFIPIFV